jgi:hypothetical protein
VAYHHHQPVYDTEYTPAPALGALWNILQRDSRCVVMSGLSLVEPRAFTLPESAGAVNRADCRALTVTLIRGL